MELIMIEAAGGVVFLASPFASVVLVGHKIPVEVRLPKGMLERGESARAAAEREVREETGLLGKAGALIGRESWRYEFDGELVVKQVSYFLIKDACWTTSIPDVDVRGLIIASYNIALELLTFESERRILARALELTEREVQRLCKPWVLIVNRPQGFPWQFTNSFPPK
jgi:8-oxo-dGTP pyrophosphatase MutT (NUDIX family)